MHFNFKIRPSWTGFQNPSALFMDVCVLLCCILPLGAMGSSFDRVCFLKETETNKTATTRKSITHALQL